MHCSEPGNSFKFNTRATISQVDFVLRSADLFYPQKALLSQRITRNSVCKFRSRVRRFRGRTSSIKGTGIFTISRFGVQIAD